MPRGRPTPQLVLAKRVLNFIRDNNGRWWHSINHDWTTMQAGVQRAFAPQEFDAGLQELRRYGAVKAPMAAREMVVIPDPLVDRAPQVYWLLDISTHEQLDSLRDACQKTDKEDWERYLDQNPHLRRERPRALSARDDPP